MTDRPRQREPDTEMIMSDPATSPGGHTAGPAHWPTVSATGHRDLTGPDAERWVRDKLIAGAVWLRDHCGTTTAISGMARGVDTWWALAALDAGLKLWAYIPFAEQTARWNRADRQCWEDLCARADPAKVLGRIPPDLPAKARSAVVNRLLAERNLAMLSDSHAVLAVWEPSRLDGGTHGALVTAAKRGMPGIHLDPVGRRVVRRLPDLDQLLKYALYHRGCGCVAGVGIRSEVDARLSALTTTGHTGWSVRLARTRETWTEGCDQCRVQPVPAGD